MSSSPPAPDPVRFGYIGCGFVGQTIHIPNFAALPNCKFLALAEVRPGLGDEVAARYGIPKVYCSHEELAADPEIVDRVLSDGAQRAESVANPVMARIRSAVGLRT